MHCGPRGSSPATLASTVPPKGTRASERENGRRASSRARLVLRRLKGSVAQILAIERQDVEGIQLDFVIVLAGVQGIEIGNTVNPKDDSSAINETNQLNTDDNEESFANASEVTGNSRIKMEVDCKTTLAMSTA